MTIFNDRYPKASKFVEWALGSKSVKVTHDSTQYQGKQYQVVMKSWSGNIGKRAAAIYKELGATRVYLVNTELHQVWIESGARYVSEYGQIRVGEVVFSEVEEFSACCRCKTELTDNASRRLGSCEDCINDVMSDPEAVLREFVSGEWDR